MLGINYRIILDLPSDKETTKAKTDSESSPYVSEIIVRNDSSFDICG
jgi:hypothetical protein